MDINSIDDKLLAVIKRYMPILLSADKDEFEFVVNDICNCVKDYHFERYDEYFLYDFSNLNTEERKTFFGNLDYRNCVKNSFIGSYDDSQIFKDKIATYEIYKDYYKRDIIVIKDFSDYAKFSEFVKNNQVFMAKPAYGSLGAYIKKINITSEKEVKYAFLNLVQDCITVNKDEGNDAFSKCLVNGYICESWIEQCDDFSQFYNGCVNTVRLVSILDDRGLIKVFAMFRTGRGGSVVDNVSAGGIAAKIDVDTGVIITDGYTKTTFEHFETHPDSNKKYKGYKIPRWNELLDLVIKLHGLYTESRYVGWDFTLTKDGWVLIEGNGKPQIETIQIINYKSFGRGLYNEMENALGRYRPK
ncbi:sugar-transfer associated ATP-grasp domain-containing protein [Eubacterium sp.]